MLIQAGAGGVGLAAIQLAKRAGATVLATASSDDRLSRLEALGLDHGINYRDDDWVDAVRRLTDGRGVDLVVDSVGGTLPRSVRSLAYRGRIAYVGDAGRDSAALRRRRVLMQRQPVAHRRLPRRRDRGGPPGPRQHRRLLDVVAAGELQVVIDRTYPLAEAAAAHAHLESRQAFGRVVLVP